jgi:hypothetical protein
MGRFWPILQGGVGFFKKTVATGMTVYYIPRSVSQVGKAGARRLRSNADD